MVEAPERDADEAASEDAARRMDRLVHDVNEALRDGDGPRAAELAREQHAADLADLLQLLGREERDELVDLLRPELDPEVLPHLDERVRAEVIERLGPEAAGPLIAELESDDIVDVLSQLDTGLQAELLAALPRLERARAERALQYPEDSAGRLMQREFVAVPTYWTVGQTIDYLRGADGLPDDFYDVYIVDPRYRPMGAVRLSMILRSRREVPLSDLSLRDLHPIRVEADQEEVAFLFRQYGLTSAPVVNERDRLLGVITVDDAIDVITEEAEEDQLKLGGVLEDDLFDPVWRTVMKRAPWLLVNLVTAVLASLVIGAFEGSIAQLTTLAVLMPIIPSMGGNAGIQTLTVVVRALATREVTSSNAFRILGKELLVGGLNGLVFLVVGCAFAFLWLGQPELSVVFGAALVINLVVAALAGVLLPVAISRMRLDPAVSSGVFLTTVTDVVGFFAFLGLAAVYLL